MNLIKRTYGLYVLVLLGGCMAPKKSDAVGWDALFQHTVSGSQPLTGTGNIAQVLSGGTSQGERMAERNRELLREWEQRAQAQTGSVQWQHRSIAAHLNSHLNSLATQAAAISSGAPGHKADDFRQIIQEAEERYQKIEEKWRGQLEVSRACRAFADPESMFSEVVLPPLPAEVQALSKGLEASASELLDGVSSWEQLQKDLLDVNKYLELAKQQASLKEDILDRNGLLRSEFLGLPARDMALVSDPRTPRGIELRRMMNESLILQSWVQKHAPVTNEAVKPLVEWLDDAVSLQQLIDQRMDPNGPLKKLLDFQDTMDENTRGLTAGLNILKSFVKGFAHESASIVLNSGKLIAEMPGLLMKLPDLTDDIMEVLGNLPQVLEHMENFACTRWQAILAADSVELGRMAGEAAANFVVPAGFVKSVKYLSNMSRLMKRSLVKESVSLALDYDSKLSGKWSPLVTEWAREVPDLAAVQSKTYGSLERLLAAEPAKLGVPSSPEVMKLLGKLTEQASESTLQELATNTASLRKLTASVSQLGAEQTERLIHIVGKPHAVDLLKSNVSELTFYSPVSGRSGLNIPITGDVLPFKTVSETFRGGNYVSYLTTDKTILYRVLPADASNLQYYKGQYWSRAKATGPIQARMDLGLEQLWGNNARLLVEVEIPARTMLFEGTAAALPSDGAGNFSRFLGGGNQVFIERKGIVTSDMVKKVTQLGK